MRHNKQPTSRVRASSGVTPQHLYRSSHSSPFQSDNHPPQQSRYTTAYLNQTLDIQYYPVSSCGESASTKAKSIRNPAVESPHTISHLHEQKRIIIPEISAPYSLEYEHSRPGSSARNSYRHSNSSNSNHSYSLQQEQIQQQQQQQQFPLRNITNLPLQRETANNSVKNSSRQGKRIQLSLEQIDQFHNANTTNTINSDRARALPIAQPLAIMTTRNYRTITPTQQHRISPTPRSTNDNKFRFAQLKLQLPESSTIPVNKTSVQSPYTQHPPRRTGLLPKSQQQQQQQPHQAAQQRNVLDYLPNRGIQNDYLEGHNLNLPLAPNNRYSNTTEQLVGLPLADDDTRKPSLTPNGITTHRSSPNTSRSTSTNSSRNGRRPVIATKPFAQQLNQKIYFGNYLNSEQEQRKSQQAPLVISQFSGILDSERQYLQQLKSNDVAQVLIGDKMANIRFAFRTQKGVIPSNPGKVNQDVTIISPNINNKSWQHFFSVCDGHGAKGHHVSGYLKNIFPQLYAENSDFLEEDPRRVLNEIYETANMKLAQESGVDLLFSGSTVNSIYFHKNSIFCANIGDSRAAVGKCTQQGKWSVIPLSRDHKPSDPDEAQRILENSGRIDSIRDAEGNPLGPTRVWLKNENIPGLAMTRSMGDSIAESVGVTWRPEIIEYEMSENEKIVVLASDGVWEFITNKEIIKLLAPFYEKNDIEGASECLLSTAHQKWTRTSTVVDDISFILIFLNF